MLRDANNSISTRLTHNMSSKRPGETTIKTSIRIRPCSQQEKEAFPGPSPVQAAPGEVRLFQKAYLPSSGRNR